VSRRAVGERGEQLALEHLRSQGYEILARNWRTREGEVDLVARDGESIVFVEVKARTGAEFGTPEEAVTPAKRRKLQRAAWAYLEAHALLDASWRIDVVAIDLAASRRVPQIRHYRDAVDADPAALP
jgi:putative endonuclease